MAMRNTYSVKSRHITGPGVGAVGVMAKPTRSRPPEHAILEMRKQEEAFAGHRAKVEEERQISIKHQWELATADKLHKRQATRRLAQLERQEEAELQQRREKLRELLAEEEQLYMAEAAVTVETTLDKQAKMRSRIKSLREERESERRQIAEERKRELFLKNCEPIREIQRQKEVQAVSHARQQQIDQKQSITAREQAIDQLYSNMWLEDKQAKDAKAERDRQLRNQRTMEQCHVLDEQVAAIEEARNREAVLKAEAEKARVEHEKLVAEEIRREKEMKERARRKVQLDLDRFNRANIEARRKRQQTELEEDVEFLRKAIDEVQGHADVEQQRKRQMQQEMQLYLNYISDMKQFRKQQQQAIERFHLEEAEKAMQRLEAKLEREQAARDALMAQVMATRKDQIASKLRGIALEQDEAAHEHVQLLAALEAHDQAEKEEAARRAELNRHHATGLEAQAHDNYRRRQEEQRRIDEEARKTQKMKTDYENKLKEELGQMSIAGTSMRS